MGGVFLGFFSLCLSDEKGKCSSRSPFQKEGRKREFLPLPEEKDKFPLFLDGREGWGGKPPLFASKVLFLSVSIFRSGSSLSFLEGLCVLIIFFVFVILFVFRLFPFLRLYDFFLS